VVALADGNGVAEGARGGVPRLVRILAARNTFFRLERKMRRDLACELVV
jgi:hypothetical protein